jgi:ribosome-binding factor A
MSHRRERVADQVRAELARLLLRGVRDPRLGFVTVTSVDMAGDLRTARVFVSVLGSESSRSDSLDALNAARGYLRREIGRSLRLRYVPDLKFEIDLSVERGSRIEELLSGLGQGDRKDDEEE